jgi:hypothetical protein
MMPQLVIQTQAELKVMFGAAGDFITANRSNTQARSRHDRPSWKEQQHPQENQLHKVADLAHPASSKGCSVS